MHKVETKMIIKLKLKLISKSKLRMKKNSNGTLWLTHTIPTNFYHYLIVYAFTHFYWSSLSQEMAIGTQRC